MQILRGFESEFENILKSTQFWKMDFIGFYWDVLEPVNQDQSVSRSNRSIGLFDRSNRLSNQIFD